MLLGQYQNVSQFEPGESLFECGPFAVALNHYAGQNAPTGTPEEVDQLADQLWQQRGGGKGIGMEQLFEMLRIVGLPYQTIGSTELNFQVDQLTPAVALDWLRKGHPLICSVSEDSIFDLDLGKSPYGWSTKGLNHIITLAGISDDGNVLVSDPASVPVSARPFPRRYRVSQLAFVSMVAITLPWIQGGNMVPKDWHDDGTTLTAPNGHKVVRGFRDYVLSHYWDPGNYPLEEEVGRNPLEESNPSLGAGTQQVFRWTVLEWTQQRGVFVAWVGQEFLKLRQNLTNKTS